MNNLLQLQEWYESQCDGDWEHSYGIAIETLDNPGWLVEIDLVDTLLENVQFETVACGDSETDSDWIHCSSTGLKFIGSCGPKSMEKVLSTFLAWAKSHPDNAD